MSSREGRKLTRGLKDLSPMFKDKEVMSGAAPRPIIGPTNKAQIRTLSLYSPDYPEDSLMLNTFLASKIACADNPCTILSVEDHDYPVPTDEERDKLRREIIGRYSSHYTISKGQFNSVFSRRAIATENVVHDPATFFIDFKYTVSAEVAKMISLLDCWILMVRPTLESISETYKLIKSTHMVNKNLDYFVLYEGKPGDSRGEVLYEHLSGMLSRYLDVQIYWLGFTNFKEKGQDLQMDLFLDHLFSGANTGVQTPEKMSLLQFIHGDSAIKLAGNL